MRGLDILFFDAGGTLLYPDPGIGETYARFARRFGLIVDPGAVERSFSEVLSERRGAGVPQSREWWREVVHATFRPFGPADDPDALFEALFEWFGRGEAWRLFPETADTLVRLRERGYRTGLVSNWDDRLKNVLADLGLIPGLDPVILSGAVGAEKPDPRIYRAALAAAGVTAGRAGMVGDDRRADVEGAQAAGLRTFLIDRDGLDEGSADVVLRGLPDLLDELP